MKSVLFTYSAIMDVKVLLRHTQDNNPFVLEVNIDLIGKYSGKSGVREMGE
jgi:hypothetical protein